MKIPQEDLNHWRAFFERLRVTMQQAELALRAGQSQRAAALLCYTHAAALRMGAKLEHAGAERPETLPPPPDVPLDLLSSTANRRYERALQEAWECALAVDRERGWPEDGPAGLIEMILHEVRTEVYGPVGSGRE